MPASALALARVPAADLANARLSLQPRPVRPDEVRGEAFQALLQSGAAARAEGGGFVLLGYLYKRSWDASRGQRSFGGFAWRFACAGRGEVVYAASEFAEAQRGRFALAGVAAARALAPAEAGGRPHALEFALAGGKKFQFAFETKAELQCWLGLLSAIVALREAGEVGGSSDGGGGGAGTDGSGERAGAAAEPSARSLRARISRLLGGGTGTK